MQELIKALIKLGAMLVSFFAFLGSSLVGASFNIQRDKF